MGLSGLGAKAFENVKSQIGICGIWCGSCVVGNGALRELTSRYKQIIEGYGLEEWVSKDFDFTEFLKCLVSIQASPICPGCRKGGGATGCEMKACASERGLDGCIECDMPDACENRDRLLRMRTGALDAGLMVNNEAVDSNELLERWSKELKNKCARAATWSSPSYSNMQTIICPRSLVSRVHI
jgi:hypothetical protein